MKIYIDGHYHDQENAKISVFDHGLLYGDGIFEGIRAYNGRVLHLHDHIVRLFNSAKGILMDMPWTIEEIERLTVETIRANKLRDAYIRLVVTRGTGDLGLDMRKCKRPTLIIIADKVSLYPETAYKKGLEIITSSLRRVPCDTISPAVKSLNYLNNVLARAEASRANAQEALLLNHQGYVAECSADNIFFLRSGKIFTPPVWAGCLEGITRNLAIKLAREKLNVEVKEDLFTCFDLYRAQEVFVTGTGAEIIAVTKIDGRVIGDGNPGPITNRLIEVYRDYASKNGTPIYEEAGVRP